MIANMKQRWIFRLVLLSAALLLLVRTGSVPIMDPDESRYARTSLEMHRSGDMVVPTFEGEPRIVKPPLLHWVHGPLFRLFGTSNWVVRLPSTLSTLLAIFLTGWIARRRFGEEGAIWAALIMTTSVLVIGVGRLAILDPLLAVHTLAVIALDIAEPEEVGPYRSLLIGALLGLAFLAKGPVGVVFPLIVLLAGRTVSGKHVLPSISGLIRTVAGWCAVSLPWGLVFLKRIGGSETGAVLKVEVLERFFDGTSHVEPPWYYAAVMLVGFMPWVAPLGVALFRVATLGKGKKARTALYCGAALLAGLLFFSLGRGKLPTYILPMAPLVAILVTWELGQELEAPRERRLGSGLLAGAMAGWAVILLVASFQVLPLAGGITARYGAAIFGAGSLFCFGGVFLHRPRVAFGSAAAASWLFLLVLMTVFFPSYGERRSARALVNEVPALLSSRPVWLVQTELPSLTWYTDKAPEKKFGARFLPGWMETADNPLLVLDRVDYSLLAPEILTRLREVGSAGKYQVFEMLPEASTP
jgi:4-amino-4-deoxy-L-arabinose transferase-like glycosyltransferase